MDCFRGFPDLFPSILCITVLLLVSRCRAEALNTSTTLPARALDLLLQQYAYGAFIHPRNEVHFDAQIPSNFSGVKLAAMRLRSGRLRRRGIKYKEFKIPAGLVEHPHVKRLLLVYQNLGNWSSSYYNLPPGYHFLTPVLGLLAYDGDNLQSATNSREIHINASQNPILIRFSAVKTARAGGGYHPKYCARFGLNGTAELITSMLSPHVCATSTHGHFSIVVNSTGKPPVDRQPLLPLPPPGHPHFRSENHQKENYSRPWKFAWVFGGVLLGVAASVLAMIWAIRRMQKQRITEMEQEAETGEALRKATVGKTVLPMATGIRTQPVLENEYIP